MYEAWTGVGRWWADCLMWVGRDSFIGSLAYLFVHLFEKNVC